MTTLQIQLFPLQTVLYPFCSMPLHIFEPRYRTMIKMCWEHQVPFGIVQIASGLEVGGQAQTVQAGTLAHIDNLTEFADGRMLIAVRGAERFRILKNGYDGACMTGVVELFEDEPQVDLASVSQAKDDVRSLFRQYWKLLESVLRKRYPLELPSDPTELSWLIPSLLHVQPELKLAVLMKTSCQERLELERELLLEEIERLQEVMREAQEN